MANRPEHNFAPAPVGHDSHTAPDSYRGFVESMTRKRARFYCPTHGLQSVIRCTDIRQLSEKAIYTCFLECGCPRVIELAVFRTPSGKAKLSEAKQRALEFKERQSLLDEMHDARLDG
jgi:predicted RNA-binding Zn-ribbon protein involved in translation (DUF1610 family)